MAHSAFISHHDPGAQCKVRDCQRFRLLYASQDPFDSVGMLRLDDVDHSTINLVEYILERAGWHVVAREFAQCLR